MEKLITKKPNKQLEMVFPISWEELTEVGEFPKMNSIPNQKRKSKKNGKLK